MGLLELRACRILQGPLELESLPRLEKFLMFLERCCQCVAPFPPRKSMLQLPLVSSFSQSLYPNRFSFAQIFLTSAHENEVHCVPEHCRTLAGLQQT